MIFLMASWLKGQPNGMAEPLWSYDTEAMEKQVAAGFMWSLPLWSQLHYHRIRHFNNDHDMTPPDLRSQTLHAAPAHHSAQQLTHEEKWRHQRQNYMLRQWAGSHRINIAPNHFRKFTRNRDGSTWWRPFYECQHCKLCFTLDPKLQRPFVP